ncbi:unnamed protein product [Acanthoscelides obtectus]|uniref:Uncharacterized protein n=1 Tax=Acanthoscelides obtectus TaxID=200917 RepID=A0A9P0PAM1_ACAOB|nr:unnamed protein product [Acanthoscelides obtectus]CAK1653710.1 hypothetical protein AOBTE_LOCUS18338 [Acanthoscelides obtectus]
MECQPVSCGEFIKQQVERASMKNILLAMFVLQIVFKMGKKLRL